MADKGWMTQVGTAAGVAAATGAAQLGLGYGLSVVDWPTELTADDSAWLGSLGWATWIAASATVFGAVVAARLTAVITGAWRFALAASAAVGALLTVVLVSLPARSTVRVDDVTADRTAGGYAIVGIALGLLIAYWAAGSRPVAANLIATSAWLWTLAGAAVLLDVLWHRPSATYLASWQFSGADGGAVGPIAWPSALLTLLAALAIGALSAAPSAGRGDYSLSTAASGAVGPFLVAAAFLALTPQLTGTLGPLESAYLIAPYAVLAGLAGSAMTVAGTRRSVENATARATRRAAIQVPARRPTPPKRSLFGRRPSKQPEPPKPTATIPPNGEWGEISPESAKRAKVTPPPAEPKVAQIPTGPGNSAPAPAGPATSSSGSASSSGGPGGSPSSSGGPGGSPSGPGGSASGSGGGADAGAVSSTVDKPAAKPSGRKPAKARSGASRKPAADQADPTPPPAEGSSATPAPSATRSTPMVVSQERQVNPSPVAQARKTAPSALSQAKRPTAVTEAIATPNPVTPPPTAPAPSTPHPSSTRPAPSTSTRPAGATAASAPPAAPIPAGAPSSAPAPADAPPAAATPAGGAHAGASPAKTGPQKAVPTKVAGTRATPAKKATAAKRATPAKRAAAKSPTKATAPKPSSRQPAEDSSDTDA